MKLKLCLLFVSVVLLQGCIATVVGVSAGSVVATSILQDKSIGNTIDDATIWTKINTKLIQEKQFLNIKVKVDKGKVLLTGIVTEPKTSLEVVKIAWKCTGVTEVINEILIQNRNESVIRSAWITSKIKTKLFLDKSIKSLNYTVVTIDDIVYLFGIAQNTKELNKVIEIASMVSGVERVINHVEIKKGN